MPTQDLEMTFDPLTIEHLGIRMYSTLPPVLAELIANSYDAKASYVTVYLNDISATKEIIVKDDGHGMSFEDINQKFLRIGRNRRLEDSQVTGGRKVIGKKGLGKLSFFGIAYEIEVSTKKDGKENVFVMRWEDIKNCQTKEYKPQIIKKDIECSREEHETIIKLKNIKRETDFSAEAIADALSKIFIIEDNFKIIVQRNTETPIEIYNERRYSGLEKEVEWLVPDDIRLESDYDKKSEVKGHLITTEKPISPRTNMRGIVLFSRKKLVNAPDYFSDSTSSHIFSYLTGWLEVDFIDDLDEDVISTDRQSVNWAHPEMVKLKDYLQSMIRWIEQDWRIKRSQIKEQKIETATGVNIPYWYSKLPEEIREKVKPVVDAIVKDAELSGTVGSQAIQSFHDIVPEYPKYHWRYLHPEVKQVSKQYYDNEDYYTAFLEGAKRYINAVRTKSQSTIPDETNMMENVFQPNSPVLSVTENFKKPDGSDFSSRTMVNIKTAHHKYSTGIVLGGRHVVAHEEISHLRDTGLFTEEDCLDALSLLSHLFRRLDKSQKMNV